MAILWGSMLFIQRTIWTRYTRVSPVVQIVLSLQNKNHLHCGNEIVLDFQSTLRCCPQSCSRFGHLWKALRLSKQGIA